MSPYIEIMGNTHRGAYIDAFKVDCMSIWSISFMDEEESIEPPLGEINRLLLADGITGIVLRLNVREVQVGDEVLVTWNLGILPDQRDWIGMYKLGKCLGKYVAIAYLLTRLISEVETSCKHGALT